MNNNATYFYNHFDDGVMMTVKGRFFSLIFNFRFECNIVFCCGFAVYFVVVVVLLFCFVFVFIYYFLFYFFFVFVFVVVAVVFF